MQIGIFKTRSDRRKLIKTLESGIMLTGTLRDESAVSNPTVTVEAWENISGHNYVYIPDFGRYYFVNDITAVRNNLWQLSLTCDVLMTYADEILNCYAIIDKTERPENGNAYIDDHSIVTSSERKNQVISFPQGFSEVPYYILATAGAVV